MKGWLAILFCALTISVFGQQPEVHFRAIDIYVDSGSALLAAYQLEFSVTNVPTQIVGIEGGSPKSFREPPFYDSKAMQQERVVIAAFSLDNPENLPTGKVRVATIHIQTRQTEPLGIRLELHTAADSKGKKISATATCEEKNAP